MLIVAPLACSRPVRRAGPQRAPAGIPAAFVAIYRESAAAFGLNWLVLAAVHQQETGFSTHPTTYRGVNFAGCCAGPFQFNVTNGPPSTWDGHKHAFRRGHRPDGYPHPQAPHPSVYDDFDAGMAAGSLLRANGADANARRPDLPGRPRLQRRRPRGRRLRPARARPRPPMASPSPRP